VVARGGAAALLPYAALASLGTGGNTKASDWVSAAAAAPETEERARTDSLPPAALAAVDGEELNRRIDTIGR